MIKQEVIILFLFISAGSELKKWSSHCWIISTIVSFVHLKNFRSLQWDSNPWHLRALLCHCRGHGFESHWTHLKFFRYSYETIAEIVEQVRGLFFQFISQPLFTKHFFHSIQEVLEFSDNKADILNVRPWKFDFFSTCLMLNFRSNFDCRIKLCQIEL